MPKFTLPHIDLSKIPCIDLSSVDLSKIDLNTVIPASVRDNPKVKQAAEAGYTAVGFAIIGFQKAQVLRRELIESYKERTNTAQ